MEKSMSIGSVDLNVAKCNLINLKNPPLENSRDDFYTMMSKSQYEIYCAHKNKNDNEDMKNNNNRKQKNYENLSRQLEGK